mgnify:FL=1
MSTVRTWITARLEGDHLTLTVAGAAAYGNGNREAVALIELSGEDVTEVGAALQKVLDQHADQIEDAALEAMYTARQRARELGEPV